MADKAQQPTGEMVIKTIAMPRDTNRYGDMFGGWLVSQMDLGGAILAHQCSHLRMTTVAIDKMVFLKPVNVGDVVSCYASIARRGKTSVSINVQVWVERMIDYHMLQVTEGVFTYVAINKDGRPIEISWRDA